MHYISKVAAVAALVSVATAGDAPVVENNPIGVTYSATLPSTGPDAITGAIKGASNPNGEGVYFQGVFYNLPGSGSLSKSKQQSMSYREFDL